MAGPGRAQELTAAQMMGGGSRIPLHAITNKKAINHAFQQHIWTMQRDQEQRHSKREDMDTQRKWHVEDRDLARQDHQQDMSARSQVPASKMYIDAAHHATTLMGKTQLEPGTPEYTRTYQQTYNMVLERMQGKDGAASLAAAGPVGNQSGVPFDSNLPKGGNDLFNGFTANHDESIAGQGAKKKAASKMAKAPKAAAAASDGEYQDGVVAFNPQTGERLTFKGGRWVPVQ